MKKIMTLIFPLMIFLSCKNNYEQQLIGNYIVDNYKLDDNSKAIILPTLNLNSNKDFLLTHGNIQIKGRWTANDNGDNTLIEFYVDHKIVTLGSVGGQHYEFINILNPENFIGISFEKLSFKRIE